MKTCLVIAAGLVALAACERNANVDMPCADAGETVSLDVNVSDAATKVTSVTEESKVNSLQVFVFRGDALDAYGSSSTSSASVSCTKGAREVWALVNCPSLAGVSSLSSLKSTVSRLTDNTPSSLQMAGSTTVSISDATPVTVTVSRMAARVVVKKVTNGLVAPALKALGLVVDEMYLTNVQGQNNYALTAPQATTGTWYNKMAYDSSLPSAVAALVHDSPSASVAAGASYQTAHYFYAYPNPSADSDASTWSARSTRLVLRCHIGDTEYFYPITLPEVRPNTSYEIENLVITRPGSDNPDTPVSAFDISFSIEVKPWTTVLVSGEGETGGVYTI